LRTTRPETKAVAGVKKKKMRSVDLPVPPAEHNAHLTGFEARDLVALGDRIQTTVREMFLDRGYEICDKLPMSEPIQQVFCAPVKSDPAGFIEELGIVVKNPGDLLLYVYARNRDGDAVVAKIMPHVRVGVADANAFSAALSAVGVRHGVLVAADFSSHHRLVEKLYDNVSVAYFTAYELVNNPAKHELTCRHQALTLEETAEFKRKFMVNGVFDEKCVPALMPRDVMTRYYDFAAGTIVRVHRSTLLCTEEPQLDAFRIVRN
jgi:hypothetical protein